MEKNLLIQKLNSLLTEDVLEMSRFGRSETLLIWIAAPSIPKVAALLKDDADLQLDWLENLSVVDLDEIFVVSYFVRSTSTPFQLVLRVSQVLESDRKTHPNQILHIPSVRAVWPMSEPLENEVEEMFGIKFDKDKKANSSLYKRNRILPAGWKGFPLRKDFQFPDQVQNIQHHRDSIDSDQILL